MTMILKCDICDLEFSPGEQVFWASVDMPAIWSVADLERPDERIAIDVCSPKCMATLGKVFADDDEEEEAPSGPEPENEDKPVPGPWQQPRANFDVTVR